MGNRFTDQVAIISGASRGIGLAIAGAYAAEGARLCLLATTEDGLDKAVQTIDIESDRVQCIKTDVRDAAACCGMSAWQQFRIVELPLIWPGLLGAAVLVFAHTLGEFGVVLMVGGNIPGETRTVAISIYDSVQAFDNRSAAIMSGVLLLVSLVAIALVFAVGNRQQQGMFRDAP